MLLEISTQVGCVQRGYRLGALLRLRLDLLLNERWFLALQRRLLALRHGVLDLLEGRADVGHGHRLELFLAQFVVLACEAHDVFVLLLLVHHGGCGLLLKRLDMHVMNRRRQ